MEIARWGEEEGSKLVEIKLFVFEMGLPPYEDAYGDRKWIRFIRGHPSKTLDEIKQLILNYIEWRKEKEVF